MSNAITALVIFILATLAHPAQEATPVPDPNASAAVLENQTSGLASVTPVTTTTTHTRTITLTSNATTVAALAAINSLALLLHAVSLRNLGRAYQRQGSAQIVAQRRAEVADLLLGSNGWRWVLNQLLADAGVAGRVGQGGVLSLTVSPASLQVAGADKQTYILTTQPDELRRVGLLARRQRVIRLDASLHPAARDEAQLLWEHLARERVPDQAPALSRRAGWFLAVVGRDRDER